MSETTYPPKKAKLKDHKKAKAHRQQPSIVDETAAESSSSLPILTVVIRLVTMVSLIVSTGVLASDNVAVKRLYGDIHDVTVHFNDVNAYRYMLSVTVIGLAYNLVETPLSIYRVLTSGEGLGNNYILIFFGFSADKVIFPLLATGLGAAFSFAKDLKRITDAIDDGLVDYSNDTKFSSSRPKLDGFFNRAYMASVFLLIAVISSLVSSILSSLALMKKKKKK